jgi:competence protein ComEC
MSSENASIAYAMLFGEKDGINKNIYNIFSIAGISHILAVSGLHIGVLIAILLLILKKCKASKLVTFITISSILIMYNTICGFSNSVVRASIMAMILLGANLFGKQYDALSSLSLAGIIICLFNPFALFSVGFQLSFACVFAIITLVPTINRGFEKIKFDNAFTKTLSMSMATSVALIPFCAH